MDPIHFLFDGSEADFLRYVRLRVAGTSGPRRNMETPVSVRLADEAEYKHHGTLDFVDNSINPKTGTIRGRALIKNENEILLPGYFGRLRLFAGERDVLMIPDSAISSDQASKVVFTVGADDMVVTKRVELGPIIEGLRVIRSGLAANDRVIIEGLQRAHPGKKVTAENGRIEASGESKAQTHQ